MILSLSFSSTHRFHCHFQINSAIAALVDWLMVFERPVITLDSLDGSMVHTLKRTCRMLLFHDYHLLATNKLVHHTVV